MQGGVESDIPRNGLQISLTPEVKLPIGIGQHTEVALNLENALVKEVPMVKLLVHLRDQAGREQRLPTAYAQYCQRSPGVRQLASNLYEVLDQGFCIACESAMPGQVLEGDITVVTPEVARANVSDCSEIMIAPMPAELCGRGNGAIRQCRVMTNGPEFGERSR